MALAWRDLFFERMQVALDAFNPKIAKDTINEQGLLLVQEGIALEIANGGLPGSETT